MHTPASRSLWLVPGRAPLTRGECGEDGEEQSRGGRGGAASANPGRRVRGAGGCWRGRRLLLAAWRKLPLMQMATVSTLLGSAAKGAWDPEIPRWRGGGTSVRVSMSVSGCDRSAGLTVTLEGPAVPGSLHVPSSGSAPPPSTAPSPPRPAPAPGPYREAPLPPVLRRPLLLLSLPAARDRPLLPPYPAARSDYRGERRGEPFGEPRNPRSPPRRQPRAGGVRAPLSSSRRTALLAAFLPCPGSGNPVHTPKRYFL